MNHQTIIVLDFGSQYTQLIARRLRELSVYSEIWPPATPLEKLRTRRPVGIILSGGPKSVSEEGAPKCDAGLFDLGTPVLGLSTLLLSKLLSNPLGKAVAYEYSVTGTWDNPEVQRTSAPPPRTAVTTAPAADAAAAAGTPP